ncbi:MAG: SAM-dependent methyltransferase [Beijerinckiaceae bacterium]
MSGFSADWLSLRESADHASVNPGVRAAFAGYFADAETVTIADLGSGSGSSLRALAPFLPQRQVWRLGDHDPKLLRHARAALAQWANSAREEGSVLHLCKAGKDIAVSFVETDLSAGVPDAFADGADAMTSSAFFDLVSRDWIERFCAGLSARRLAFYAALTYDGREQWRPPHPADAAMLEAFHADQHRDKGFGPAAGPQAAEVLESALRKLDYRVIAGESPWRLGSGDAVLMRALAEGSANAVAESGRVSSEATAGWRNARIAAKSCLIGHRDICALPA